MSQSSSTKTSSSISSKVPETVQPTEESNPLPTPTSDLQPNTTTIPSPTHSGGITLVTSESFPTPAETSIVFPSSSPSIDNIPTSFCSEVQPEEIEDYQYCMDFCEIKVNERNNFEKACESDQQLACEKLIEEPIPDFCSRFNTTLTTTETSSNETEPSRRKRNDYDEAKEHSFSSEPLSQENKALLKRKTNKKRDISNKFKSTINSPYNGLKFEVEAAHFVLHTIAADDERLKKINN